MRVRVNKSFGVIKLKELNEHLFNNSVYSMTVSIDENILTYSCVMMFRNNKKDPEWIHFKVSRISKNVIDGWTDKGHKFKNVQEILNYTKK